MFIRCARLCCLCLKQCAVNIEAAHIRQESKGGTDDEDNGIPVCFDCHQQMESYVDTHPKGNKFRPTELRARRDHVYSLVESGALYAQVIARQLRESSVAPSDADIEELAQRPRPTGEAKRLLEMLTSDSAPDAPDRKIKLLPPKGQAYVLDSLLEQAPIRPAAVKALCRAATPALLSENDQRLTVEQLVRAVTLFGTPAAKSAVFENLPPAVFGAVGADLRSTLFQEAIEIIGRDQFSEVNDLVPAIESHISAVPVELHPGFAMAILKHAWSDARRGAPAARRMLAEMPDAMAGAAIGRIDKHFLYWYGQREPVRRFLEKHARLAGVENRRMLADVVALSHREFRAKYFPGDAEPDGR